MFTYSIYLVFVWKLLILWKFINLQTKSDRLLQCEVIKITCVHFNPNLIRHSFYDTLDRKLFVSAANRFDYRENEIFKVAFWGSQKTPWCKQISMSKLGQIHVMAYSHCRIRIRTQTRTQIPNPKGTLHYAEVFTMVWIHIRITTQMVSWIVTVLYPF